MTKALGEYVKQFRLSKGFSPRQLALKIGYQNLNRGIRRINRLEQDGIIPGPLILGRLVKVLGISHFALKRRLTSLADDRARFFDFWKPPFLFREVKGSPGCLGCIEFPPKTVKTLEEIENYSSEKARRYGSEVCLVADAYTWILFDENGVISETLFVLNRRRGKHRRVF